MFNPSSAVQAVSTMTASTSSSSALAPTSGQPSSTSNKRASSSNASGNPNRPKRSQVSRACDWCRVHRIKCDAEQPCHNCRSRGGTCSTTGASEIRTLPHAFREIERLKRRVQELEQEVERRDRAAAASLPTPNRSPGSAAGTLPPPTPTTVQHSSLVEYDLWREHDFEQRPLAGLYTRNGNMPQKQLFGPSSLLYFISRMTTHLAAFLEHPPADHTIQYNSSAKSFVETPGLEPNLTLSQRADQSIAMGLGLGIDGQGAADPYTYLTAMQEEYFLNFFWQSYHCSFQIVDEASFREHYKSLWAGGNSKTRKPSALVDIILALCIQLEYDTTSLPRGNSKSQADSDTELAGRWHYQRCQTLLISELESPTISTLQCHIFSVIYLCCASFQNMAHSTLALAVRTAHILGLHLEPPQEPVLPRTERELRKRLWWTLYTLESKTCMKLGRPWSAPISDTHCSLPSDDHQLAIQSGSAALAGGNVTWLTYTLQNTKLVLAARNVYVSFYHEAARILGASSSPTVYDDPAVLEACANLLKVNMAALEAWTRAVPEALKTKRKRAGEPFSTDGSRLAIEAFAPLWLQRQRLFLELLYHNLCVILYRPLVSFTPSGASTAEACAAACVSHAITMTHHIHQALSETDLLKGWHESFQWQWNGAITIIGFILANPLSPQVGAARESIRLAVEVFEIFGKQFAVGRRAAKVVGELMAKADALLGGMQAGLAGLPLPASGVDAGAADPLWQQVNGVSLAGLGEGPDATLSMMQDSSFDGIRLEDVLSGTMDVAFSVDSYNNFELLHGSGLNFPDLWSYTTEA